MAQLIILVIFSYLLGSVPSAYIAGKMKKGLDIRKEGSGNVGATNTLMVVGPFSAVFVYAFDLLKGLIPVLLAKHYIGTEVSMGLAGLAAVIGHDFSIFLRFSGGKGIATTTGAIFGINPSTMWILIAAWIIFVFITDYFIVSSLLCLIFLPVLMHIFRPSPVFIVFGVLFFLLGLFTHWKDIVRIRAGHGPRAIESMRKYFRK
jgi:glycerol-3-phosphate acyltransferase PlsY